MTLRTANPDNEAIIDTTRVNDMTHALSMTLKTTMKWMVGLVAIGLMTGCATRPTTPAPAPQAALTAPYEGLFISAGCAELTPGLYYADALELKPRDARFVDAGYFKVFFSSPHCERQSQLIKFTMPQATWEVVGQTLIDGKHMDQVIVTLVVGQLKGEIFNKDKVKETPTSFVITYGEKNEELPLHKETEGSIDKELRLIENGRLYTSDPGSPTTPDGFPTFLLPPEEHFKKQ